MTEPRVPGAEDDGWVELPCGEEAHVKDFDMGMREFECSCGATHAVVMDMHPPSRFVPEDIVAVLQEAVTPAPDDEFDEFGTPHLLGAVLEQLPESVEAVDQSENGSVGYALMWVTDMESRELHEVVVELVVELMDHAVSHADDDGTASEFEAQMREFDVGEFVEAYRARRDFDDEHDTPA